jgi:single-strand DNA-binding protein
MQSFHKIIIIGTLSKDAEFKKTQTGSNVITLTIPTSERYKDKSGQIQEKTEWHNIYVYNDKLWESMGHSLKKGCKLYVEGRLQTYEKNGKTLISIIVKPFKGEIQILNDSEKVDLTPSYAKEQKTFSSPVYSDMNDEIPF